MFRVSQQIQEEDSNGGEEETNLEAIEDDTLRQNVQSSFDLGNAFIDRCNEDDKIANSSGEPACIAVTEEISAGQSLHPCSFGNVLPACAIRKIDAIIAIQQSKERVEFSINEWKKNNASTTTAIKQQSRRLRSNLSILYQSKRKLNIQIKDILAIDFVCKYS
ncbi:hypothetical protein A0J61_08144 [Choanephora cucurbitarum]|uniref:Uncharacterized protein n=1 Tax=Choanephora cucurbitarum TaxID=101091 RepID=A0A1C7N574_9FUNG|nr:hypothetical protein A0J61_08144 [Choanephora cucurbitarum]